MPAIDVMPNIKIAPYTIAPEIQEACKLETPEEQFLRVDPENTTEVDFEGYNKMVDNCGRAYRQQDFDRIDTNSKRLLFLIFITMTFRGWQAFLG